MIRVFQQRAEQKVSGFQSPADDYLEGRLQIETVLVVDPESTFYVRMEGSSMLRHQVFPDDILVVDRSLKPKNGALVIAVVHDSFLCRKYEIQNKQPVLKGDEEEIQFTGDDRLEVWGVVTSICRGTLPKTMRVGRYKNVCAL